jgi:hypothetical protein
MVMIVTVTVIVEVHIVLDIASLVVCVLFNRSEERVSATH